MIVAFIINHRSKNARFYLDSATKVYMYYKKLLFSIYKEQNLSLVYTANNIELNFLRKRMVILNMLVDTKSKIVNFCNIFYVHKLKCNFFLVDIIEKASYLILAKKIIVFNNKKNVVLEAI